MDLDQALITLFSHIFSLRFDILSEPQTEDSMSLEIKTCEDNFIAVIRALRMLNEDRK